jgi:flagellar biosynthesis/type III secretory pathway protein FliH
MSDYGPPSWVVRNRALDKGFQEGFKSGQAEGERIKKLVMGKISQETKDFLLYFIGYEEERI